MNLRIEAQRNFLYRCVKWYRQLLETQVWCNTYTNIAYILGLSCSILAKNNAFNLLPTGIVHGELKLSSFIFDDEVCICNRRHKLYYIKLFLCLIIWSQCNVKAIIGWKSTQNGDPLVDVAHFLAMFLQPANYGYTYLQDCDLLMGRFSLHHTLWFWFSFVINCDFQQIPIPVMFQAIQTRTPHQRIKSCKRSVLRLSIMASF